VAKDEQEDEMEVGMADEVSSPRSNPQHLTGTPEEAHQEK
jgi:hypothetical protein